MSKGNLIDRYVMEVGRRLPQKQRADVQLELRSALQDALDERGLDADRQEDEDKVVELLKEFGKPSHVAEGYGAHAFLVGPELLSFYWGVLRISAFGVSIAFLVLLVLAALSRGNLGLAIGETIGGYVHGLLVGFAVVTIIFILLERLLPGLHLPAEEWDPRSLPQITPDRDKVEFFELIVEIIFTSAFLTVINLLPVWQFPTDLAVAAEIIDKLLPFIPWISALAVMEIVLDVYLLNRGRWDLTTRWISFVLAAAGVAVVIAVLQAAPYSSVALADSIVRISIAVVIVISLLETAVKLYKALRPGAPLPWESWPLEQTIEDFASKGEAFGKAVENRFKKK